jgi:hypothetical protein
MGRRDRMAIRKRLARRAQREGAQPARSMTITDPRVNRAAPVVPSEASPAAARATFRNPDAQRFAS